MTIKTVRVLVVTALAAGAVALPAAGASAATTDPAFGSHVAQCARTMGFNGAHNPGMHQGASGWDGMTMTMPTP
ncbi:MAG: hypothetical protein ABIP19_12795 [Dermatophilaceae bacterium]